MISREYRVPEFRVALKRQDMVANLADRVFTKFAARQHPRTGGVAHHLVLVAHQDIEIRPAWSCQAGSSLKRWGRRPMPQPFEDFSVLPQGVCDQLVAETDSHQLLAASVQPRTKSISAAIQGWSS